MIGHVPDRRQQLALERNSLQDRAIRIEWMRPPRFAEAADQHLIGCLEKPHGNLQRVIVPELFED